MRILILSCNTGQGHNSAAAAIKEYFSEKGVACDIYDALCFISDKTSKTISEWHTRIYRNRPGLFRWGYHYADVHRGVFRAESAVYKFLTQSTDRLYHFCRAEQYDAVLCTHAFSGLMVSDMRKKYDYGIPAYFVATDYTCSPSTEQGKVNRYFIPSAELAQEFVKCGLSKESLIASGIPIRGMFFDRVPKNIAKQSFDIPADHQHILLMCGSMGCGPIKKIVKLFSKRLSSKQDLTVVCGTNRALYQRLAKKYSSYENIHIHGYIENVALLMYSADLYLTKPGGISVTEASAVGVPMVFINAVAGCEEYNMHYFIQHGAATTAKTPGALVRLSFSLLSSPDTLEQMGAASRKACCGNGAQNIYNILSGVIREA